MTSEQAVVDAKEWVKAVAIHYDRPSEVEEALFGEHGRLFYGERGGYKLERAEIRQLRVDQGLRKELLALWRGYRHVGEKLEREQVERLRPRPTLTEALALRRNGHRP